MHGQFIKYCCMLQPPLVLLLHDELSFEVKDLGYQLSEWCECDPCRKQSTLFRHCLMPLLNSHRKGRVYNLKPSIALKTFCKRLGWYYAAFLEYLYGN